MLEKERNNLNTLEAESVKLENVENNIQKQTEIINNLKRREAKLIEYIQVQYYKMYRDEYEKILALLQKTEPLTQNEMITVKRAEAVIKEINEALELSSFHKYIDNIEKTAVLEYNSRRQQLHQEERERRKKEISEKQKQNAVERKKEYESDFIDRNGRKGSEFLQKVASMRNIKTSELYPEFVQMFPSESAQEFWEIYLGKKFFIPTETSNVVKREPFVPPPRNPVPLDFHYDLNKKMFNFEVRNGQFYNKEGKPVDVLGFPVEELVTNSEPKGGKSRRRRTNRRFRKTRKLLRRRRVPL